MEQYWGAPKVESFAANLPSKRIKEADHSVDRKEGVQGFISSILIICVFIYIPSALGPVERMDLWRVDKKPAIIRSNCIVIAI